MDASTLIDKLVAGLPDWRGPMMADIRRIIWAADPEIAEEWKWMGTPVWSHAGIVCIANPFKDKVKVTFYEGARLFDPEKLYNTGLAGNKWRSIDYFQGDQIRAAALKNLVRSAVEFNLLRAATTAEAKPKAKLARKTKTQPKAGAKKTAKR